MFSMFFHLQHQLAGTVRHHPGPCVADILPGGIGVFNANMPREQHTTLHCPPRELAEESLQITNLTQHNACCCCCCPISNLTRLHFILYS
ncbi:hypothetical protein BAUCODRAFT_532322 [Baudoinia panamericana UAMH 10762]|uniref:Uncharacterized protein n=1 Tax=Baudoinia panamericana (strain UAMH 10762) TaxID=717646 RepID=M2N8Q0_BAUPA|nr:uncharacterized protein BAUCODRAFT_532322 [Baudoinia panamericana UAMH 10762]EMC95215.1 hypothetical protein BAUCODRAFT_532322 [Baudoinia panamericana UAMH 10762]